MSNKSIMFLFMVAVLSVLLFQPCSSIDSKKNSQNDVCEVVEEAAVLFQKNEHEKYQRMLRSEEYLECAYQNNSLEMLDTFLNAWSSNSRSLTKEELELKPTIEQEAYKIFETFYKPYELDDYIPPPWEHQNENYKNNVGLKFIIVQKELPLRFMDTSKNEPRYWSKKKIDTTLRDDIDAKIKEPFKYDTSYVRTTSKIRFMDFAPKIAADGCNVIYPDEEFLEIINEFIEYRVIEDSSQSHDKVQWESERRLGFLRQFIIIDPEDWKNSHNIFSFPLISLISNLSMTEITVFYQSSRFYVEEFYTKENGKWILIGSYGDHFYYRK